jgi:hypothetical protein
VYGCASSLPALLAEPAVQPEEADEVAAAQALAAGDAAAPAAAVAAGCGGPDSHAEAAAGAASVAAAQALAAEALAAEEEEAARFAAALADVALAEAEEAALEAEAEAVGLAKALADVAALVADGARAGAVAARCGGSDARGQAAAEAASVAAAAAAVADAEAAAADEALGASAGAGDAGACLADASATTAVVAARALLAAGDPRAAADRCAAALRDGTTWPVRAEAAAACREELAGLQERASRAVEEADGQRVAEHRLHARGLMRAADYDGAVAFYREVLGAPLPDGAAGVLRADLGRAVVAADAVRVLLLAEDATAAGRLHEARRWLEHARGLHLHRQHLLPLADRLLAAERVLQSAQGARGALSGYPAAPAPAPAPARAAKRAHVAVTVGSTPPRAAQRGRAATLAPPASAGFGAVELSGAGVARSVITAWSRPLWADGRERQVGGQCLKHAVNNMVGFELLTVEYMNYLSVRMCQGAVALRGRDHDWSGRLLGAIFAVVGEDGTLDGVGSQRAVTVYQQRMEAPNAPDITSAMLDRRANPGYRWYHYVSLLGVRDDTRDPYGFILHGDNHFFGIRCVPPAAGGGGARWEILDSLPSEAAALMGNAALDALLCERVRRGYCVYSLAAAQRPSEEQLRAQQGRIIKISIDEVARGPAAADAPPRDAVEAAAHFYFLEPDGTIDLSHDGPHVTPAPPPIAGADAANGVAARAHECDALGPSSRAERRPRDAPANGVAAAARAPHAASGARAAVGPVVVAPGAVAPGVAPPTARPSLLDFFPSRPRRGASRGAAPRAGPTAPPAVATTAPPAAGDFTSPEACGHAKRRPGEVGSAPATAPLSPLGARHGAAPAGVLAAAGASGVVTASGGSARGSRQRARRGDAVGAPRAGWSHADADDDSSGSDGDGGRVGGMRLFMSDDSDDADEMGGAAACGAGASDDSDGAAGGHTSASDAGDDAAAQGGVGGSDDGGDPDTYAVSALLDHRVSFDAGGVRRAQYKVRWVGYASAHDTWEARGGLAGCGELLAEYHNNNDHVSVEVFEPAPTALPAAPLGARPAPAAPLGVVRSLAQLRQLLGRVVGTGGGGGGGDCGPQALASGFAAGGGGTAQPPECAPSAFWRDLVAQFVTVNAAALRRLGPDPLDAGGSSLTEYAGHLVQPWCFFRRQVRRAPGLHPQFGPALPRAGLTPPPSPPPLAAGVRHGGGQRRSSGPAPDRRGRPQSGARWQQGAALRAAALRVREQHTHRGGGRRRRYRRRRRAAGRVLGLAPYRRRGRRTGRPDHLR